MKAIAEIRSQACLKRWPACRWRACASGGAGPRSPVRRRRYWASVSDPDVIPVFGHLAAGLLQPLPRQPLAGATQTTRLPMPCLSACCGDLDKQACRASGAEIVLLKAMPPVTPADELVDQVEAMLQNPWQERTGAMGSRNSHLACFVMSARRTKHSGRLSKAPNVCYAQHRAR